MHFGLGYASGSEARGHAPYRFMMPELEAGETLTPGAADSRGT